MNISEIKERVGSVLRAGFDHKFLNQDNKAFADVLPTVENVARQLFLDAAPLFRGADAQLVACHLAESEERSATYFAGDVSEANYWFEFSAARQTMSPALSARENTALFGTAASPFGHGHNYRGRLTSRRAGTETELAASFREVENCLASLRTELDHKNLNCEVPGLTNQPITTENLARYVHERANTALSIDRVRLHERDDFFAEYAADGRCTLARKVSFDAAHRLHSLGLSGEENAELYGKCNNSLGHGHRYLTEATVRGHVDETSGTLMALDQFDAAITEALRPLNNKHLDLQVDEFRTKPSTGENIVKVLWPRFDTRLDGRLSRLRLWETANNRFTLRKI